MRAAQAPSRHPPTAMHRTHPRPAPVPLAHASTLPSLTRITALAPVPLARASTLARITAALAPVPLARASTLPSLIAALAPVPLARASTLARITAALAPVPLVRASTLARIAAALALGLLGACATPPEGSAPPPQTGPAASPAVPTRTANNDPRSAGLQPDYDGEAAVLREAMLARLPATLPADRRAACTAMLDTAAAFYGEIEAGPEARARLQADLQATRADDLTRCERETSVRAATCVGLRLGDHDAELPWLLDQCTRAFPD